MHEFLCKLLFLVSFRPKLSQRSFHRRSKLPFIEWFFIPFSTAYVIRKKNISNYRSSEYATFPQFLNVIDQVSSSYCGFLMENTSVELSERKNHKLSLEFYQNLHYHNSSWIHSNTIMHGNVDTIDWVFVRSF